MKQEYYLNKCSSENQIGREETQSGYKTIHNVEDKKVVLTFNQYANGEDDFDDELVNVEISPLNDLLNSLPSIIAGVDFSEPLDCLASITGQKLSTMLGKN